MDGLGLTSKGVLALGVALVLVGFVAPLLQVHGSLTEVGPAGGANSSRAMGYWTDSFETPFVYAGKSVHVQAVDTGSGRVEVSIVQQDPSGDIPDSYLLSLGGNVTTADITIPVKYDNPYIVLVTSYNSTYSVTLDGVWAQYSDLNLAIYWGITFILVGVLMYYYYRIVSQKEAIYRKALEDAKRSEPKRS